MGQRNHILTGGADPPSGEEAIWGVVQAIQKHGQSSLQPLLQRRGRVRCKKNNSFANNVMQQKR